MARKMAIILNGISLQKKKFYHEIFPQLKQRFDVSIFETASRNDAVALAAKAASQSFDLVVAAGGDGTVFQVANGLLQARPNSAPTMAVIPLGSGNDFARGLGIAKDTRAIITMFETMSTQLIDVGLVRYTTTETQQETRYFLNVVDVGMGPEVVKKVLASGRPFGSAVAYYASIISTFFSYTPKVLKAVASAWTWEHKMRTFAIANGKYYGHGLCIAPLAKIDDGMFEVFACADASVLDFMMQSTPLKKGKKLNHPKVSYYYADRVELTAPERCAIEADGELLGTLPAVVEMSTTKLRFLIQ